MRKLFLIILALSASVAMFATDDYFLFSPKGVAKVEIHMLNGKRFGDVWVNGCILDGNGNLKENWQDEERPKLEARMVIKNSTVVPYKSTYAASELYDGKIFIGGRGNTSFHNQKRGYSIDLVMDNLEDDNPKPLLGMASHEKWALVSRYDDRTVMRDMLAFWLGRQMKGLDYTPDMRYVEVTVFDFDGNEEYRGLYCLSEKAGNRSSSRIDVKKLTEDPADQVAPRVTGGYILEVVPNDKMKDYDEYLKRFPLVPGTENSGHNYVFNYPKSRNITDAQRNYMIQYMTDVYNVLQGNNFADPINGYAKYIDVNSFIDWCILHDIAKGTDNLFHASVYLHKDRNEKLKMSVPWDFDLSFGNVEESNSCYYEDEFWIRKTHYFSRLWEDPNFREKLKNRYDELMPIFDLVPYVLQENYKFLEERGVWQRDYNQYGRNCLDGFRYADNIKTRKGHVRYLTEWFESRKAWLYYNLGETPEERCDRMQQVRPVMRVMQPEKLLACDTTLTRFMRSGNNNYNYSYNLIKPTNTDEHYGSDWYEIKRNDGEYRIEIIGENGCVSIPSLPVQLCEERIYEAPPIIENPEYADYWIYEDFSQFALESNYNTTKTYQTFPNNIALAVDSANVETGDGCTAGIKTLRIRGARFGGGSAEFTVPNAGKVTMALSGKSTNKDRTIYIYRNGSLVETLTNLDRTVCVDFEEEVNSSEPQTYKIMGGNNTHQPIVISSIVVEKYSPSSIETVTCAALAFYPNPTKEMIYFTENVALASLYDISGRLVSSAENANQMNVRELGKGIYVIKISTTDGIITGKLIKE